jgi:hypothetical protein
MRILLLLPQQEVAASSIVDHSALDHTRMIQERFEVQLYQMC